MKLTEKQLEVIWYHAKKARVSFEWLVEQVRKHKVTITELAQGILWVKLD